MVTTTLYSRMAPCGCFETFANQETDFLCEFKYWFLALNWHQGFLGRSILFLKNHKVDERELSPEEHMEKLAAYCAWYDAVQKAFQPDKINQSQLGNEEFLHKGHVHWHFVPRYRRPVTFAGATFLHDDAESQKVTYSDVHTRDKRLPCPVEVRRAIKEELLKYLRC